MADEKEVAQQYTKEELETIGHYNAVVFAKDRNEAQRLHEGRLNALALDQGAITLKNLETVLESNRQHMRPHMLYRAEVVFEVGSNKYRCQLPTMGALDDEESEMGTVPVCAYGDTPAEACENFDALWIGSNNELS